MTTFLAISLGFPTVVYSVLLLVVVCLWLISALGLLDLGVLDFGFDDGGSADSVGLFSRLGLDGMPLLLVVSLPILLAWAITCLVHLFLLASLPGLLRYGVGAVVVLAAPVPAILLTAAVLRPFRRLLLRMRPLPIASLLGKVAVVRTPTVGPTHGMADLDDRGAGLILQVRSAAEVELQRGDRIVLMEHDAGRNTWRVVPERDYLAL